MTRIDWTQRAREFLKTAPPSPPKTTETPLMGVLEVRPPLIFKKYEAANEPTHTAPAAAPPQRLNLPEHIRELCFLTDAELERMEARYRLAARYGLDIDQTEQVADDLLRRDRRGLTGLHACIECQRLEATGHCAAARAGRLAGTDRESQPAKTELRHCPAFVPHTRD